MISIQLRHPIRSVALKSPQMSPRGRVVGFREVVQKSANDRLSGDTPECVFSELRKTMPQTHSSPAIRTSYTVGSGSALVRTKLRTNSVREK